MVIKKSKALKPFLFESDFNVLNKKVISGLINSVISPVFASKEEINIVCRFLDEDLKNDYIKNYLPRLKFLNTKIYDLEKENLETTEFLIISTRHYSACVIFDFSFSEIKNEAIFCSYLNSKKIEEILKIILPNEKFPPERRENTELNKAFLNLIKFNENSLTELNIKEEEKKNLEDMAQNLKRDEVIAQRARFISHEIKNQLSIIDIYTKLTQKLCDNNPKIMNAGEIIFKSIKNVTILLSELKTFSEADLNVYDLSDVIIEAINSVKEMAAFDKISLTTDLTPDLTVVIDKNKFQNVLLNLVKNAVESFKDVDVRDKYIDLSTRITGDKISLIIANNGAVIEKSVQNRIFEEGFTTKEEGSGLGLYICRQNLKEQFCDLTLLKSSPSVTVFEISMKKV